MQNKWSGTCSASPSQDKKFGVYEDGFYKTSFDSRPEAEAYCSKHGTRRYSGFYEIVEKE